MKTVLLLAFLALPLCAQVTDPDAVAAKVAIDSLAGRLVDKVAELATVNKKLSDSQGQVFLQQAMIDALRAQLAAVPPPDKVVTWISAMPTLYSFLAEMSVFPISSFYSPGKASTPGSLDRHTLACISNSGFQPVSVSAVLR